MTRQRPAVRITVAAALAVILALVSSTGCELAGVTVKIPDFDSASVRGLQLWKYDRSANVYRAADRVEFGDTLTQNGGETLFYSVWRGQKRVAPVIPAVVERAPRGAVTLRILLPALVRGEYRVSSYNTAGNSELSQNAFTF